jgi:fructose-1,6-bisphosphatase/inositol monophosphatase family enzyme
MSIDPGYAEFVELLAPGVRRAAAIARSLEGRVPNQPKRDESTAVKQALTFADTQCQEALLESLYEHFPGVRLAAEEDTPGVASFSSERDETDENDALVVIDPIDGTLHSYLEGRGPYAVMIGLVLDGVYRAGLVALPREGLLFGASRGAGAWSLHGDGPPQRVAARADGNRILVSHGMPAAVGEHLERNGYEVTPACGGAVAVAPLVPGVRAGLRYACGDFGVSIRGRIGCRIAIEAGARVLGPDGGDFPLDVSTPARSLRTATGESDLKLLGDAIAAANLV